jgi:hypothetical protein
MNRTLKEATAHRYHYDSHQQLRRHLDDFVNAYNFGRRLKTLKGLANRMSTVHSDVDGPLPLREAQRHEDPARM